MNESTISLPRAGAKSLRALQSELQQMKRSQLWWRVQAAGISEEKIDDARDADDAKMALIGNKARSEQKVEFLRQVRLAARPISTSERIEA